MERFFDGQVRKLISLIRDRSPEADAQLAFMAEWGGGPLGAAALVAEAWLQDRAGFADQASEQLDLMPWDSVEPRPSTSASIQEYDAKVRSAESATLADSSTAKEPAEPCQLYLDWKARQQVGSVNQSGSAM